MIIIFLGPPGSGKGTQAKRLSYEYNIPHISTGDIIRDNIKRETELGKKTMSYTHAGKLVPDALICDILFDRISEDDCKKGYILDGFPRTIFQAERLDEKFGKDKPVVINLEVNDEIIIKRLSGRETCQNCGQMYNLYFSPPKELGKCDKCGGDLIHRKDDLEDVVKERLEVYKIQTEPLISYYTAKDNIHNIDGLQEADDIFKQIQNFL